MKERLKWLMVGVGVMYATQLIILLIVRYLIPLSAPPAFSNLLATITSTLIAFLAGGFVIGLMAERIEIIEPALATAVTLLIDLLAVKTGWLQGMFLFSLAVTETSYGTALTIGSVAIVASIAGALAGERLTVPWENWFGQGLVIVGLGGILLGPFFLVSSFMPVAYAITLGLVMLGGVVVVSLWYGQREREEKEISIRPEGHESPK
jgi:hypothetical protein